MKKFIILASIFTVLGTLIFVISAKAQGSDPLTLIWDWIGQLRERVTNLETEFTNIELTPGPEGPRGPVGSAGPPGPAGQQLHLYDANGQDLGIILDSNFGGPGNIFNVFIPQTNKIAGIDQEDFSAFQHQAIVLSANGGQSTEIFFSNPGCSGTPYSENSFSYHLIIKNGAEWSGATTQRFFVVTGAYGYVNTQSKLQNDGVCISNISFQQKTELQEVTLPFTLPLAWPLHIQ